MDLMTRQLALIFSISLAVAQRSEASDYIGRWEPYSETARAITGEIDVFADHIVFVNKDILRISSPENAIVSDPLIGRLDTVRFSISNSFNAKGLHGNRIRGRKERIGVLARDGNNGLWLFMCVNIENPPIKLLLRSGCSDFYYKR